MEQREDAPATASRDYAERLYRLQTAWWKRMLGVQRPYAWNLRRLRPGFLLDVGCGIGRNLEHLGGHGVGIDDNPHMVEIARARGFEVYTPADFVSTNRARPGQFDALLCAHVLEHLDSDAARSLLAQYAAYVRPGGRLILITPQERGFASDATHVRFVGFAELQDLLESVAARSELRRSFPFPRRAGRFFVYNEFVVVGRLPDSE